jgi:hypothetical protein
MKWLLQQPVFREQRLEDIVGHAEDIARRCRPDPAHAVIDSLESTSLTPLWDNGISNPIGQSRGGGAVTKTTLVGQRTANLRAPIGGLLRMVATEKNAPDKVSAFSGATEPPHR